MDAKQVLADAIKAGFDGVEENNLQRIIAYELSLTSSGGSNLSGSGAPSGSVTPTFIGQFYTDTSVTPNAIYQSTGLTSADWTLFGDALQDFTWTPQAYALTWGFALTGDDTVTGVAMKRSTLTTLTVLDNTALTSLTFAALTTLGPPGAIAVNQARCFWVSGNSVLPSLTFPALVSVLLEAPNTSFRFESNAAMTTLSFPAWTTVNAAAMSFLVTSNPALTTVSFPVLTGATTMALSISTNVLLTSIVATALANTAALSISSNSVLAAVSLPALASVTGALTLTFNTALVSISMPSLVTVTGGISAGGLANLTTVTLTAYLPTNGQPQAFNICALTQASVDHVLARAEANPLYVSGVISLDGGTNSTPSAAGLASKAVLVGRGVTVTNN